MIHRKIGLGIAAAAIAGVTAFSAQAENVRVAFIDPLSGGFAAVGISGLKQFQFIAEEITNLAASWARTSRSLGTIIRFRPKKA